MNKTFIRNLFYNNFSQGLQFGSRWILNIALISVLDIEAYALYSFLYSLSNILLSVLPFGSSTYLIANAGNGSTGNNTLKESNGIITFLFIVLLVVYIILTPFLGSISGWSYSIYGIVLSYLLSLNLVTFSYYKGAGKFNQELIAYSLFGAGLLLFTGYLYFIEKTITDIRVIFLALIVLNALILCYCYLFTELKNRIFRPKNYIKNSAFNLWDGFRKRKYFGFQDIVTAIYSQAGLLILFYIIDDRTYGYYRALFVVVAPIFMVTVAISQVVLRHLSVLKKEDILKQFRTIQRFSIGAGLALCLGLILIRQLVFSFINIESNRNSIIAYFIIIGITFMRFVFSNYEMLMVVFDMQKQRFYIMVIAALISIFSIFMLLPEFGLIGAVSTNAISYAIVLIGLLLLTEFNIKKSH